MIRKIALASALALTSVSGAFAFNNVGEIESRPSVQVAGLDAYAAARREMRPVVQDKTIFDRHADVSNY